MPFGDDYRQSLAQEKQIYRDCANVHNLPEIFHYWSNRHIRPKLLPHGFESPNGMFEKFLERRCTGASPSRFVSIGAGNCDLEIGLAQALFARGHRNFTVECLDVNPEMLERGKKAAQRAGVWDFLSFVEGDFNDWRPATDYDAVLANQSLHHVSNLEGLFDRIKESLTPGGVFLVSDMIGRNGHQRWPEALRLIHEFWRKLPPSYRFNLDLERYEELYQDVDCSSEGFEGVRAQDILPLLIERFHFHLFIPFGNIIDPFVDRSFGPHFNAAAEWDRRFIDEVHARDEAEQAAGHLTPTHMLAVLQNEPAECTPDPASRVRDPNKIVPPHSSPAENYEWDTWPHDPRTELAIACRRLAKTEQNFEERTKWVTGLQQELAEVTRQLQESRASLHTYLHNPIKYATRLLKSSWKRVF